MTDDTVPIEVFSDALLRTLMDRLDLRVSIQSEGNIGVSVTITLYDKANPTLCIGDSARINLLTSVPAFIPPTLVPG